MRSRFVAVVGVLVTLLSLGVVAYVLSRPDFTVPAGVNGGPPRWLDLTLPLSWTLTGAVLLWLRPRNAVGALLLVVGSCQALSQAGAAYGMYGVGIAQPHWPAADWIAFLLSPLWIPGLLPLVTILPAIYPDGHLPSRRWRLPVAASVLGIVLLTFAMTGSGAYDDIAPGPAPVTVPHSLPLVLTLAILMPLSFLGGLAAIWIMSVRRLIRSQAPLRQQLAWLLCGVMPFFVVSFFSHNPALGAVLSLTIPVGIAVGITRYQALGIDIVLRRGLVYGVLTAAVIGVYLLVAAIAGARVNSPLPNVVAAAGVVVGLAPLRERVQRTVDRLIYGQRRDPLRAVAEVGDRLSEPRDPAELLPTVLATVMSAVRAPGASIVTSDGRTLVAIGEAGAGESVSLRVSGRDVGLLHVTSRSIGEPYTDGDRRLLAMLAPQVAVVTQALDLAEALETERDRVLGAAAEERARLTRDLHDGLGPSLAGVRLGLVALESALDAGETQTAGAILARVRQESQTALAEVRRIIDDLRPLALDQVGLVAAIARRIDTMGEVPRIELDVSEPLPPLALGVETAAYRIVQEALTNAARHAQARRATVSLGVSGGMLRLEVCDDGCGIGVANKGVGLASMRHRAEALQGNLAIDSDADGTRVVAELPLQPVR
jgi:signal transduction histidine kinase